MKRARVRKIAYTYKGKTVDRYLVDWDDLQGVRREKRFHNKRHADEYANRVDKEREEHIHVADRATITLGKMCQAWLKQCEQRYNSKNRTLAGNTYHSYLSIANNHVLPRLGRMKLSNRHIHRDVQAYINELSEKYKVGGVPKQANVMVWNVLEFAVHEGVLPRNPLSDRKIKLPGRPHRRTGDEIPTFDDVKKLLTHLHEPKPARYRKLDWAQKLALVTLAAFGGLRSGECAGLDWSNIDLAAREIKVKQSLSKYDGIKQPKSEAGIRTVPMNPILHNVLKSYAEFMGKRSGPLFRSATSTKPYPRWVQVHLNEAMASAGLVDPTKGLSSLGILHPKFTFHGLRHFAGSAWLAQGMKIQDVSWLLGHSNIQTTMSIYAHQLKGDDHARRVLDTQIIKFPGIPHSGVTIEPPPPAIESSNEAKQIEDMTAPGGVLYQPIPIHDVPGLEAVPTIAIPPEAPDYFSYAVRLLQSGWEARDVAKEIGISRALLYLVFRTHGMDTPRMIGVKAREARIEYLRDHGYTLKEAARIVGVHLTTVSAHEGRLKAKGRQMMPRRPGGRPRKALPHQVIENKAETAVLPAPDAGNMREKQFKLL